MARALQCWEDDQATALLVAFSACAFLSVSRGQVTLPSRPPSVTPPHGRLWVGPDLGPSPSRPVFRPALYPHPGPPEALPRGQVHGWLCRAAVLRGRPTFSRRGLLGPGLHPRQPEIGRASCKERV